MASSKQYKKKVKPGLVELDQYEPVLIVHIETQLIDLAKPDLESIIDRKLSTKRIRLKAFATSSSVEGVAKEVVSKCKYIHHSKTTHVEDLLRTLQSRLQEVSTPSLEKIPLDDVSTDISKNLSNDNDCLKLYSSTDTKPISSPPRPIQNLEIKPVVERIPLNENPVLMESLQHEGTTKQGETEKIAETTVNIQREKKKRKALAAAKRILESNIPKEKPQMNKLDEYVALLYENEIEQLIKGTYLIAGLVQNVENIDALVENYTALGALARVLTENRKKNSELTTNVLEIFFCFSNFSALHMFLIDSKIGDTTMRIIDLECQRYDIREHSYIFLARQEKLLYVAFYILLNLAEDIAIEVKMVKRGIVQYLIRVIERTNEERDTLDELQLLAITFLKKLSVFKENTETMIKLDIIQKLIKLLPLASDDLLMAAMRLFYNLSFDSRVRAQIIQFGGVPLLVKSLLKKGLKKVCIRVLYNVSTEAQHRAAMTEVESIVLQMTLRSPKRFVDHEVAALAINMSVEPPSPEVQQLIHQLVKRVHQTRDPLLMKILHNIAVHPGEVKQALGKYVHEFVGMLRSIETHEFLLETLGVLVQLDHGVAFARAVSQSSLVDFLAKLMMPGFTEDDVSLEATMLVGTLATDPAMAPLLANPNLVRLLSQNLDDKVQDEEVMAQTLFTIYRFMLHEETRTMVLANDAFISCLVDIEQSMEYSSTVREQAEMCVGIAAEFAGGSWGNMLTQQRFEAHNCEWIEMMSFDNDGRNTALSKTSTEASELGWGSRSASPSSPRHLVPWTHTDDTNDAINDDNDSLEDTR